MTIISSYSISPSFAASDAADENDARNRRVAKRKIVNEPPLMRQAERKNSEKLLSEAMQLASYKAQRQLILDRDTESSANRSLELMRAGLDSARSEAMPETASARVSTEQSGKLIAGTVSPEEKSLQCADFAKELHEIESGLAGIFRRGDPAGFLENLKNFSFQLSGTKHNLELQTKKSLGIDILEHDLESMNCSLEFIEGYCDASSFSDEMKKKISDELVGVKLLLNPVDTTGLSAKLPEGVIEAVALQVATVNVQKSLGSNPNSNDYKANAVKRKEAKDREDSLPLATLRSI